MKVRKVIMSSGHYQLVASIIRGIADPESRKATMIHFGDAFTKRSPTTFDYYIFRKSCGFD